MTIFTVALFVGLICSMIGLGGGTLLVPIYTLALSIPIHTAIGTSMVAVIATSSSGAIVYIGQHITNIRLGVILVTGAAFGAVIGAMITVFLVPQLLTLIFAFVLIYISTNMVAKSGGSGKRRGTKSSTSSLSNSLGLSSRYFDGAFNSYISYRVENLEKGVIASFFIGILSAMLGVAGGFANVPLMYYIMKMPIKVATATSNYMGGIIATAAALVYFSQGLVDPLLTATTAIGVLTGAQTGSRLARRTKGNIIRIIFGVVLFYISIRMLFRGINIEIPF